MNRELADYEEALLDALRGYLRSETPGKRVKDGGPGESIRVEGVELDTSGPERMVVVLLRDQNRPECLFGFEMHAIWPEDFESNRVSREAAETHAMVIWANLHESLVGGPGLPRDCSPGEVTRF